MMVALLPLVTDWNIGDTPRLSTRHDAGQRLNVVGIAAAIVERE
jgi:hypothetical protein